MEGNDNTNIVSTDESSDLTTEETNESIDSSGGNNDETDENGVVKDGSEGETSSEKGTEDGDIETVEDEEGKKFVPFEAFKARIDKLTAQKHQFSDAATLLESIRTDPRIREEFVKSLGIEGSVSDDAKLKEGNEPTAFEKFLAPLPANHQAHYRAMGSAIAEEFEAYVENFVGEKLAPIMRFIGSSQIDGFSSKVKDFSKYQKEVASIISSGRAKSIEDAYILASYQDKLKGAGQAKAKEEVNRFKQSQRFSNSGVSNSNGKGTQRDNSEKSLKEILRESAKEVGYIK